MKRYTLLFLLAAILISCGKDKVASTSLEQLNSQKNAILQSIDSLNKELKVIEQQMVKLDTAHRHAIVTVLPVKFDVFKHFVETQGVVKADKNIEIRPEMGGTVETILVKEGQKVYAGQVLVQLDDASIKNSINELKIQLDLAKTTFERQQRLWNQKIGSEMQYLQAKTQKESIEKSIASLQTQAKKMQITAPFAGIVDEIFPKKGELTSPQTAVVRLLNLDVVYVEADITETYLPIIKKNTEVLASFPSINKEIEAKITHVGSFINPDNRSFKVRITIPNPDGTIKPNLMANLKILDFKEEGIQIPNHLVQQDQTGKDFVYIVKNVNGEHIVAKNNIDVVKEYNKTVFVGDGLSKLDTLINLGARLVKTGDIVEISQ
jgi:RND family efflux transporter MFP subunit